MHNHSIVCLRDCRRDPVFNSYYVESACVCVCVRVNTYVLARFVAYGSTYASS